jgi:hypothetical protein
MRGRKVSLKGSNSHSAVDLERQQRGGDALHLTMQFSPLVYRFDGHQESFCLAMPDSIIVGVLWQP